MQFRFDLLVALALSAAGVAAGIAACATGQDTSGIPMGFGTGPSGSSTSSSSGGGSSSGSEDATLSGSSGGSGGYGDDTSNSTGYDAPSTGDDGGSAEDSSPPGPTCTPGQTCVDGIPSGWSGYVQILVQTGDAGTACSGPYDTVQPSLGGQTDPDGGPATCGSCNCTVPDSGLGCTVTVENDNTGCIPLGTPTETTVSAGQCTKIMALTGTNGHIGDPATLGGTCIAQGGAVTAAAPPPTFSTAVACAASDGGGGTGTAMTCQSGQGCAALPSGAEAGTPSGVCMYQAGIQSCPPPGTTLFTNTIVVGSIEDDRGCACTCGAATCPGDGYVAGFTNSTCSGAPTYTFDAGAACASAISSNNRPTYAFYHLSRSDSAGTCGAATSGPTGGVDIDGGTATTFCCIP